MTNSIGIIRSSFGVGFFCFFSLFFFRLVGVAQANVQRTRDICEHTSPTDHICAYEFLVYAAVRAYILYVCMLAPRALVQPPTFVCVLLYLVIRCNFFFDSCAVAYSKKAHTVFFIIWNGSREGRLTTTTNHNTKRIQIRCFFLFSLFVWFWLVECTTITEYTTYCYHSGFCEP